MSYPNNKIWEYYIFLGTFTDSLGRDLDLGVFEHKNDNSISYAVAFSDDGDYYSGGIRTFLLVLLSSYTTISMKHWHDTLNI